MSWQAMLATVLWEISTQFVLGRLHEEKLVQENALAILVFIRAGI